MSSITITISIIITIPSVPDVTRLSYIIISIRYLCCYDCHYTIVAEEIAARKYSPRTL